MAVAGGRFAPERGSAGLIKAMGRPVKLSAVQLVQARWWAEQGVSGQEIARRLQVSDTMISHGGDHVEPFGGYRSPLVSTRVPLSGTPQARRRSRRPRHAGL